MRVRVFKGSDGVLHFVLEGARLPLDGLTFLGWTIVRLYDGDGMEMPKERQERLAYA